MREHVEIRTLAERLEVAPSAIEATAAKLGLAIVRNADGDRYLSMRAAGKIVEAVDRPRDARRWRAFPTGWTAGSARAVR